MDYTRDLAKILAMQNTMPEVDRIAAKLSEAQARIAALKEALRDAIQFAVEGWSYAPDYFKEKWEYEKELAELRARLPNSTQ
jgi:predicted  nucleic acid-binding Zn-ribbon protein